MDFDKELQSIGERYSKSEYGKYLLKLKIF